MTTRLLSCLLCASLMACGPNSPKVDDDKRDKDGDGYAPAGGDCDDTNPEIYPGAYETVNGIDDDCDGKIDNGLPDVDDDGDGFTDNEGDCDDENPMINPDAFEITETLEGDPEGADNNCNGQVDEVRLCDGMVNTSLAADYAKAIGICHDYLLDVSIDSPGGSFHRNLLANFGVNSPTEGNHMAVLSNGIATAAAAKDGGAPPGSGPTITHPLPQPAPGNGCGTADPASVNDPVSVTVRLKVPLNAQALAFDFAFFSAEYPDYVCQVYDDTFLALLQDSTGLQNIAFDSDGRATSVNASLFDVCPIGNPGCAGDADLIGTGFDTPVGGGTGWLTTIAPVTPNEEITLTFMVFDEGDWWLDSLVLVDHFRWLADEVDGPVTVE